MLGTCCSYALEHKPNRSWYHSRMVLILKSRHECHLFLLTTLVLLLQLPTFHNICPVAAEHRVGLAAACLPICQHCHVVPFSSLAEVRLDERIHLSLCAFISEEYINGLQPHRSRQTDFELPLSLIHGTSSLQFRTILQSASLANGGLTRMALLIQTTAAVFSVSPVGDSFMSILGSIF